MKKILIGLILLSSLSALSAETVRGVVTYAECRSSLGIGMIELRTRDGDTLISHWYRVKSRELCSSKIERQFSTGMSSKLSEIHANNATFRDRRLSTFTLDDEGAITSLEKNEAIDGVGSFEGVSEYKDFEGRETRGWYSSELFEEMVENN